MPVLFFVASTFSSNLFAQQTVLPGKDKVANGNQGNIYLVFPFENAGSSPRLDWIGEGLEELTIQRLSAAGQQVYSREGRINELDRYGLPPRAKLSRATMLRLAEELDADFVIFGTFSSDGKTLTVVARTLRVNPVRLLPALREAGQLDGFMELHTRLVWRMLSQNDRGYPYNLAEFAKTQRPLRLDAFEQYVRGLLASEEDTRLRELREAARLDPEWTAPIFALGQTYFARNDCNNALPWLARVPAGQSRSAEAVFSTGVCRLRLNQPDRAEEIFASLQESLSNGGPKTGTVVSGGDLPEILNNLALARARQGKSASAESDLKRASQLDPDEDDYTFNSGLLAWRKGDFSAAAGFFKEAAQRQPENAEDRALLIASLEKSGKKAEAEQERLTAEEILGPSGLPAVNLDAKGEGVTRLERVKAELDTTTLRTEIEPAASINGEASGGEALAARDRRGRQEIAMGNIDAAEREFRTVLTSNPADSAAHFGLGEIYRRRGRLDDAVKELQASLASRESAVVRTRLARIYLAQNRSDLALVELQRAIKLAPNYAEAKELLARLHKVSPASGVR
ncbi:MAG TPA: tetratricopeptide repeat protein [Candidatus Dormibacteraeota bacterium]|nr:tetratricopeptide repeat protein [Candidatus Dormibacteraeota bacterium]